jgi:hypothetical protein
VVNPGSQEHSIPANGASYRSLSDTCVAYLAIGPSPSYFLAQFQVYHGHRELGLLIALALVISE